MRVPCCVVANQPGGGVVNCLVGKHNTFGLSRGSSGVHDCRDVFWLHGIFRQRDPFPHLHQIFPFNYAVKPRSILDIFLIDSLGYQTYRRLGEVLRGPAADNRCVQVAAVSFVHLEG